MNGIFHKSNILQYFFTEYKSDVFGVAEPWLLPNTPASFVSLNDYNIVRSDTPGDIRKHDVCMYVKKKHVNFIHILPNCSNVCIAYLLDFNLYVVVIYENTFLSIIGLSVLFQYAARL